jgi:transposase
MANKPIVMSKLKKVLQLYLKGKSKQFISKYLNLSRNTVRKYLRQLSDLELGKEDIDRLSDLELEKLFVEVPIAGPFARHESLYKFFPYMEKELKKTGVTRQLMWQEYIGKYPDGLRSTQFCEHYNRWSKKARPSMRMTHKAGDKLYVDYAGKLLQIVNKESGEITPVQFFVAILGASQYTYAEASLSQKRDDFVHSVENALIFFGGVPQAIVPDNLKAAVTKPNRYEPTLNETFLDFAEHYGTTILPARVYKPKDKSLVEGAVRILYTRIYSFIRNEVFFDLDTLNKAIKEALQKHNNTNFSGRPHSRKMLFDEVEQQQLSPLPKMRYQIKYQAFVTVMQNGHVNLGQDKHYYSVPYQYIRKKVKILYSSDMVEVFYKYNRIAVHKRIKSPYSYTTVKDHLASAHRFMTEWTPQRFINWGANIDDAVKAFIVQVLEKKQHPEQAYKSCMGILSMERKVGRERLANACKRALEYGIYNYMIIKKILDRSLDKIQDEKLQDEALPKHKNIRGEDYYH